MYAVKQIAFLGTPVTVICQNINGPCPLLAICNVLLLRGHLSIQELVSQDGLISAHDLMRVVQNRLVAANPLVRMRVCMSIGSRLFRSVWHVCVANGYGWNDSFASGAWKH